MSNRPIMPGVMPLNPRQQVCMGRTPDTVVGNTTIPGEDIMSQGSIAFVIDNIPTPEGTLRFVIWRMLSPRGAPKSRCRAAL